MELDRWVLPPAAAAAFFAVVAISPPIQTADLARVLRVELAREGAAGPLLLRVSVDALDESSPVAPRDAVATAAGQRVRLRAEHGATEATGALQLSPETHVVDVEAQGRRARVAVPSAVVGGGAGEMLRALPLEAVVAEANLLPEEPGTVYVRAPGAVAVRITSQMDGITVEPPEAPVGACDIARFRVTVAGMGAPVTLEARHADGSITRAQQRLSLQPGGLSLRRDGGDLVVRGAFAQTPVWLLFGRGDTAHEWRALRLSAAHDGGEDRVRLPEGAGWVLASTDPRFRTEADPSLRWDAPLPDCATTDDARGWYAAHAPTPPRPRVTIAWNGVAHARSTLAARVVRARRGALAGLAVSIGLEIVLVLGLGLRGDARGLAPSLRSDRARFGALFAGVAVLLVLGFALALASLLSVEAR